MVGMLWVLRRTPDTPLVSTVMHRGVVMDGLVIEDIVAETVGATVWYLAYSYHLFSD
jgi:hypothetical protein